MPRSCDHEGCACKVAADARWCSSYCANVDSHGGVGACSCGHEDCANAQRVATGPGGVGSEIRTAVGPEAGSEGAADGDPGEGKSP
jgi:hypothetical protein